MNVKWGTPVPAFTNPAEKLDRWSLIEVAMAITPAQLPAVLGHLIGRCEAEFIEAVARAMEIDARVARIRAEKGI